MHSPVELPLKADIPLYCFQVVELQLLKLVVAFNPHAASDFFQVRHRQLRELSIVLHREVFLYQIEVRGLYFGHRGSIDGEFPVDGLHVVQLDGSAGIVRDGDAPFDILAIGNLIGVALARYGDALAA